MGKEWRKDIGEGVLRDVSRSFFLTLKALPRGMRAATSVGYLMARASDTIADCGAEREVSLRLLEDFRGVMEGDAGRNFFESAALLAKEKGLSSGERVLMTRLEEVFSWLESLPEAEGEAVREVVSTIISGQKWDLERFPEGKLVTLSEAAETKEYCYRVAGCVGEFWTRIGFLQQTKFARLPQVEMERLGRSYGEGLQLVNILRDEVEDEERGRRYLVGPREDWLQQARADLADGLRYCRALRSRRVRFATVLPALIGLETLKLLEMASQEELAAGVKVSRRVVKRCLWRAFGFRAKRECPASAS